MQIITLTTISKNEDKITKVMGFNTGRIKQLKSPSSFVYDEGGKLNVNWTVYDVISDIDNYIPNLKISTLINKWGNNSVNDTRTLLIDNIVYITVNPFNISETLIWYRDANRVELTQICINQTMIDFITACNNTNKYMRCFTFTHYLVDGDNTVNHSLGSELVGLEIFRAGRKITIDDWYNIDENNININIPGGGGFTASINCYIR